MWCRSSDTPSIITFREYNSSNGPSHYMKTRAVSLHLNSQVQLGLSRVEKNLAMLVDNVWQSLDIYIYWFVRIRSLRLIRYKRKIVVFCNTTLNHHKPELVQNASYHEFAFSIVLPRVYHELAIHLCGSNFLQCVGFGVFQESSLCFDSASDTGNFNL